MKKMQLSNVLLLALLLNLSCLWVAKASGRRARVIEEVRDATTMQHGGPCTDDNTCHKNCSDCKIAQCIFKQCVCSRCFFPPQQQTVHVGEEARDSLTRHGETCNDDKTCQKTCSDCQISQCIFKQCVCSRCFSPPSIPTLRAKSRM